MPKSPNLNWLYPQQSLPKYLWREWANARSGGPQLAQPAGQPAEAATAGPSLLPLDLAWLSQRRAVGPCYAATSSSSTSSLAINKVSNIALAVTASALIRWTKGIVSAASAAKRSASSVAKVSTLMYVV